MKQRILVLFLALQLASTALYSQTETQLANDVLTSVKYGIVSFIEKHLPKDEMKKNLVTKKWELLVGNTKKSGIRMGSVKLHNTYIENIGGTIQRVMLITYTLDNKIWDDVVLLLDRFEYTIHDISLTDAFMLNEKNKGLYYNNLKNLYTLFVPKPTAANDVVLATQEILTLVQKGNIDSLCTRLLFTNGYNDTKRKNRAESCNPKIVKDREFAEMASKNLRGIIANPREFEVLSLKKGDNTNRLYLEIKCPTSKNIKRFTYDFINGKYLLDASRN